MKKYKKKQLEKKELEKKELEKKQTAKPNNKADNETEGKEEKRSWKEILYNCPCLLMFMTTSIVAMLCSDEIGVNMIPMGRDAVFKVVEISGTANTVEAAEDVSDDSMVNAESVEAVEDIRNDQALTDLADVEEEQETKDKRDSSGQTIEENESNKRGITRFEYYEPRHIESRYYSDAGKVALTTEYDYTLENTSYFNDAAFLGDSRTLGISDYAGFDSADFYCDNGMTIFKLLGEDGVTYQKTGKKVDLNQVLQEKQYGKIYIMLGMNELGYGDTEMYLKQYREVVEQIQEWQPDAIIYIMANLHVSREKNNSETEFNNININDKNAASALLADGINIFYLDSNPLFTDEEGFLNADLTFDGVHLYAQHYDAWRKFLLEHGVEHRRTGAAAQHMETTEETEEIIQNTEDLTQSM